MATWNGSIYIKEDFSFPTLTSAVSGINTSVHFKVQSTAPYTIEPSNGTVRLGSATGSNFAILSNTRSGWLTGRRPPKGQLYPRGVYNK